MLREPQSRPLRRGLGPVGPAEATGGQERAAWLLLVPAGPGGDGVHGKAGVPGSRAADQGLADNLTGMPLNKLSPHSGSQSLQGVEGPGAGVDDVDDVDRPFTPAGADGGNGKQAGSLPAPIGRSCEASLWPGPGQRTERSDRRTGLSRGRAHRPGTIA